MIKTRSAPLALLALFVALVACAPQPTEPPPAELPRAVDAARNRLSAELAAEPEEIEVVSYEEQQWPDACLGLPQEDEACAQVITAGYRVVLRYQGTEYVYRTDESGTIVRLEETSD